MRALIAVLLFLSTLPATAVTIDRGEFEAFADGIIETTMENEHVAGTVLGVVHDGEVILLKGYGKANVETGAPVDPARTLFRPGSVTKLFTWIALMQLREAGKVDFDTDINTYLDGVKVPSTYPEPVTINHLMSHTPGFEDHVLGLFSRDEASMRPLAELLRDEMPDRVRPPGQYASYSNHGVALAGLIVEQVSGEPWASYVENSILSPLGLNATTMVQPLPESLAAQMSNGYAWQRGEFVRKAFEFVPAAPAGGASASGSDMTKLVQALLTEGGSILSPAGVADMLTVLHKANDRAGGLLHGFYEFNSHGQRILGHGGDTLWFHSELVLIPEQDFGWFISTNSQAGPNVRSSFRREVLDRYFGKTPLEPVEVDRETLTQYAGYYGALRHSHSDFTKLIQLLGAVSVQPAADGKRLTTSAGGETQYLVPVGEHTFRSPASETIVSFDVDDTGTATHMHLSRSPVIAFERMSGLASPALHQSLMSISAIVVLWILVGWSIQRHYRRFLLPPAVARYRLAAWWMALTVLAFGFAAAGVMGSGNEIAFGITTGVRIALAIPWLIAALALVTVALTPGVLSEPALGIVPKAGYLVVTLSGLSIVWFLAYWRVLTV